MIVLCPAVCFSLELERVGDTAWADVGSVEEFETVLEEMLVLFEEHAVIRLPLKRCLEEEEIKGMLEKIYYRRDLVAASIVRMEATVRYASRMNTVEFLFQWIDSRQQREEVREMVPRILSSILAPGMSERQILEAIHDHVVSTVLYDDSRMGRGAWEALRGRAVCQGYALLTGALLSGAGFDNRIVLNSDHAWNLVFTEGKWRHIDTAFDDPVIIGGGRPEGISREAFLKTDAEIRALGHNWDANRYPKAK
ncbi:MAG TPA: hypothetical protein ENN89_02085 [Synergistetes bacterium]|nr:hypothetical protein [Synergistota bacterium]